MVACPSGQRLLTGGFTGAFPYGSVQASQAEFTSFTRPGGWRVEVVVPDPGAGSHPAHTTSNTLQAHVVCQR